MVFDSYEKLAAYINENPDITELEVDGDVGFLPVLPRKLLRLTLRNSPSLNYLPDIPPRLCYLSIENCGVYQLPPLPMTLQYFRIHDCPQLTCPFVVPSSVGALSIRNCPETRSFRLGGAIVMLN